MKKFFLTVVAVMAITVCNAKSHNVTVAENVDNYSITFDMRRLAVTLDLTYDQMEAVKVINDNLNDKLMSASTARRFERPAIISQALRKDAKNMRNVLNDKQYDTYMKLMRATLQNKVQK